MFRCLRKIPPSALLLNIYKAYVQSKIDYGLSVWGCATEVNLNRVQWIQSLLARIMCNNFDYIHSRGIDLFRSLKFQILRERRDSFLCVLMFKCIHGLAPHYCPACRTYLIATRFWVVVICPRHYQVPHCIRFFFYFVWFVFIHHNFQFYFELCTYCNILDIYLS